MEKHRDLEEHFFNSSIIINQQHETEKEKQDLAIIVDKLTQEMVILQKSEQDLTLQLRKYSDTAKTEDGINLLYMRLKEKYSELQNEYNQLEKRNSALEEKFTWVKNELTEDCLRQIKIYEEKITEQRNTFIKKERELDNELEAQQALADLRYDDMESRLQSHVRDITRKLHDSTQSCNRMRDELLTFKGQNSSNMDAANKRIQELEKQLRLSQQQLQLTQEKLFNTTRNRNPDVYLNNDTLHREINQPKPTSTDFSSNIHTNRPSANIIKNRIVMYNDNSQLSTAKPNYVCTTTKYHSLLAATASNHETSSSEEFPEVLRENVNISNEITRDIQCVAGSSRRDKHTSNKSSLPPLKQVSTAAPKQRINVKKRKLYNPNNLDYLNDMEAE